MRVFFVCQRVPYPPNRGDKIATCNEIRHLAAHHEVHVFCLAAGKEDLRNVPGLQGLVQSVTAVPVGRWSSRVRALRALLTSHRPLSVAAFDEPRLHQRIAEAAARLRPDLIVVFSSNVAQYAVSLEGAARVMQFADLDSLKWRQYAARAVAPMKWIYASEARRLLSYERHIAHTFDHSIVITRIEQADFEELIPGVPVSQVGNGVDLEYFRSSNTPKQPHSLVFTGVMDYLPNVDAVEWFCLEILPRIRADIPQASFTICGSRPSRRVRELARLPGVEVTGMVPDTRPYLDRSQVFVAPLRMARGVQNKILEALAMRLPTVSCTPAWRGTVLAQGEGILVADEPVAFAAEVVGLLRDDRRRALLAQAARQAAERYYRWDVQMQRLDEAIAAAMARHASPARG
ncbi:MAG: TIGR03087 family PEP-CTERM/XrtA system glycosyltransferase [Proteobacteria bacterium]|nr:TIGR03087 family PEP-CTERM/XrtA system glycosyltransferase [Pseudomonadota bacterium]